MNRTAQLHKLMDENGLTTAQVAELLNRSAQTVRTWRCKFAGRVIPEHSLEVLRSKVSGK